MLKWAHNIVKKPVHRAMPIIIWAYSTCSLCLAKVVCDDVKQWPLGFDVLPSFLLLFLVAFSSFAVHSSLLLVLNV